MPAIVELAKSYEGCGAGSDPIRFVELLGVDGWWRKAALAKPGKQQISCCGLVGEGFLRMAGLSVPASWVPYAPSRASEYAIARAQQWAIREKRLRSPNVRPELGSYVCIGDGLRTHALTVIDFREDDQGVWLISMDGGMQDQNGLQTIKQKERLLVGSRLGDRRLNWWISTE